MEFMLIGAGAIAVLGFSALIPRDRRDAIRDAAAGCHSGQSLTPLGSCETR